MSSMTVTADRHPVARGPVTDAPPARGKRERLLSLDVFRGITVAAMLLVNNPGSWSAIYPPLRHAEWHGWTPTDLIFPFFLFIVGITTHLSLAARRAADVDDSVLVRQILRRGALIFVLGFLLSAFPFFTWTAMAGDADPSIWTRIADRFANVRIPGVLQRIGIAYACGALLSLRTTLRQQVTILAVLLLGYWVIMTTLPVPDHGYPGALVLHQPGMTMAAWVDRLLLDGHLWAATRTWDPEGVLSTLPAIGTVMLGILGGRWIASSRPLSERVAAMFAVGTLCAIAGAMWGWSFPINKGIWTSSYVLFTAGLAAIALATCMWIIDEQRVTWWTRPFVIYGVNPLLAFLGSGLMARLIYSLVKVEYEGRPMAVQAAIYQAAFASWLAPRNASLLFAVTFVALWLGILTLLHRRNIMPKV